MIRPILPTNNPENYREKLSKTDVQKKRIDTLKEGFLINNFVKDSINNNVLDIEGNYIIPQVQPVDNKFDEQGGVKGFMKKLGENPLLPICLTAVGILGGAALCAKILHNTAKMNFKAKSLERLPDLPRNMNLKEENDFVTYIAIQNPNIKNILGAIGAISFAGGVFIVKNFVDGFKDIWVKKQDASIQRNLQEDLISVETKSFAGKNTIIRNMMREKADEMTGIMKRASQKNVIPPVFEGFTAFKGQNTNQLDEKDKKPGNMLYLLGGALTLGLSVFFIKKTLSSIRAIGHEMSKYNANIHKEMDRILNNTSAEKLKENHTSLLNAFSVLNFKPDYVKNKLQKAGFNQNEIGDFVKTLEKRYQVFVEAPEALGGKKGIQYYSYIDDVQGHFYNWIMNNDGSVAGKFMKNLFVALATVGGLGYLGKTTVEAVKDVQVKKYNAKTDLNLHKELVDVELRNFESKKRSNIDALMHEFVRTARTGANTEKLHKMAGEILYEIKNGAPFVYS